MRNEMAQYHCNYCQEDINGLRVKCAECVDFDLCLQCFSCGAEIGCHKNAHSYQIIDCGNFPIFETPHNWKAKEEVRLLDAIEHYGFGNWEDIANQIESKNAEEAKDHYSSLYICGNIGCVTWPKEVLIKPNDHTCLEGGPLSPSLSVRLPALEITLPEQQELGYLPNRDDFEREFDNEAELLVSNLVISPEDEDIDLALKVAHVDIYSRRLRERLRRKRIAREYGLVAQFYSVVNKNKGPNSKKRHSKEDKEFQERMCVMAQFHSSQEHEQLFENLQKEKELKIRIKELVRYRRNGLSKLEDCSEFETARYKREKRKEIKKKAGCSGAIHHRKSSMASKRQGDEKGSEDITQEQQGSVGGDDAVKEDETQEDVDVSLLAGAELLSSREKKLCRSLGLRPASYITLKAVLLKDHLLRRQGVPVKGCHPFGLDKMRRRRIINFMVSSGWITTP